MRTSKAYCLRGPDGALIMATIAPTEAKAWKLMGKWTLGKKAWLSFMLDTERMVKECRDRGFNVVCVSVEVIR